MQKIKSIKLLIISIVICALCVSILFGLQIQSSRIARAEEAEVVTVSYYYNETLLEESEQPKGEVLTLPDIYFVKRYAEKVPSNCELTWKIGGEDGETVEGNNFSPTEDVKLYATFVLIPDEEEKFVYEYIFNYKSKDEYDSFTIPYRKNSCATPLPEINGCKVIGYYEDPKLRISAAFSSVATRNERYYVKLEKKCSVTVDGKTSGFDYAQNIDRKFDTDTTKAVGFYLDEELTEPFEGVVFDGLVLFTAKKRTHFTVTLVSPYAETVVLVPVSNPYLTEDKIKSFTGYWYFDSDKTKSADLPLKITADVTLYGQKKAPLKDLSTNEIIAIVVSAIGAIILIILASLYQKHKLKTRKQRREEEEARQRRLIVRLEKEMSRKPLAGENADSEEQENHDR